MNQALRVAFIAGQLSMGGAERQLYYLLAGLDRTRFTPVVITLGPHREEYWERPITGLGVRVHHVARTGGRAVRAFRVARLLAAERASVVHSWVCHTNPYAALAGRLSNVGLRIGSMREHLDGLPDGRFFRWVAFRDLDVLITNSASNAQCLRERQRMSAVIRLVPNGVVIPEQAPAIRCRLRAALGYSDDHLVIGSIGRIDENKNHSMLLRAFASLAPRWPMLQLLIIGDGPQKNRVAAMASELGITSQVRLPGLLPDAATYLAAVDIFCLTSYSEGMPNSVMEAAAAGLPIVSTTCGDSIHLIEHGASGFLVPPNDDNAMCGYLDRLLADASLRFRLGLAGKTKMRDEFTVATMVRRMTEVYDRASAKEQLS